MYSEERNCCLKMNGQEFEMIPLENKLGHEKADTRELDGLGGGTFPFSGVMPGFFGGVPNVYGPNLGISPMNPLGNVTSDLVPGLVEIDELELDGPEGMRKKHDYDDVRRIVMKIQRYNPGIFRRLMRYGMPYYEARNIVRRIVRLSLLYSDVDKY